MAQEVYRKSVLEKLSSPEQLDKMITIISPMFWIAAMGGGLILAVALTWSILGRLPVNVTINGIYMTRNGIHSVHAETSGTVQEVLVSDGVPVFKGQALVQLEDSRLRKDIEKIEARRELLEAVTFDSVEDVASADNKNLLDIKSQKLTASSQLVSNRALLEQRRKDLAEQDAKTATAKQAYEAAQKEYFDSISSSDTSAVQVAYQSAQSELSSSRSYLESAKASLSQARTSGTPLSMQKAKIETDLTGARRSLDIAQEALQAAREAMLAAEREQQEAQTALSAAQMDLSSAQSEQSTAFSEKASAEAQLSSAKMELDNAQLVVSSSEANRKDQIEAIRSQIAYTEDTIKRYEDEIKELQRQLRKVRYRADDVDTSVDLLSAPAEDLSVVLFEESSDSGSGVDPNSANPEYWPPDYTVPDQIEAQESQLESTIRTTQVYLNNAKAQLEQLQSQLAALTSNTDNAQESVKTAEAHIQEAEEKVSETSQRYEKAETAVNSATLEYNRLSDFVSQCTSAYNEKSVAYQEANAEVSIAQSKVSTLEAQLESVVSQMDAANANVETAQYSLTDWEAKVADAQSRYNAAEERYIRAMREATQQQAVSNKQSTIYSEAMNQYTTELSLGRNLNDSIIQLMAQISAEESALNVQNAALAAQFDTTKASTIDQLDREVEELRKQLDACTIRSTLDGVIYGLNVVEGGLLQQAAVVCKVASAKETEDKALICYAPIDIGRKITPGMRVVVYPTTVNRQEYGHMEATVTQVADYVTSVEDMRNQLGDDSLVQSFSQNGPVIAVTCELRKDENTVSGYWWSNRKGAKVDITEGTMASTDIITEEKAPITMLIPLLKEKLTIRRPSASANQQNNT